MAFIYTHLRADGKALYVGRTIDLEQRTAQHRSTAAWRHLISEVCHFEVPDCQMYRAEREEIERARPIFNKVYNPRYPTGDTAHYRCPTGWLLDVVRWRGDGLIADTPLDEVEIDDE